MVLPWKLKMRNFEFSLTQLSNLAYSGFLGRYLCKHAHSGNT